MNHRYDAVIVGAGHNGLVAACYLALAGLRVLILEKNETIGGATQSQKVFPGVDARVSVYSYLVSLLPGKIISDLGIRFETRRRAIASYTPLEGRPGLLISNVSDEVTRRSFHRFTGGGLTVGGLTGGESEYDRYRRLQERLSVFAEKVWPTLLGPLPAKAALREQFNTPEERQTWDYLVEKPLGCLIEDHLSDDTVRGAVFTDAKIGVSTHPHDPTLLQNRTFLYHIIGQGSGEWRVPVGGMGALVGGLIERARGLGVEIRTHSPVLRVAVGKGGGVSRAGRGSAPGGAGQGAAGGADHEVTFSQAGKEAAVSAGWVLFNTSSDVTNRILPGTLEEEQVEGAVFKINMVLKRLPALKDPHVSAADAFTGTFHLNEGYENMQAAYRASQSAGTDERFLETIPGEMYCHSLTDPSILGADLREQGFHTLTLFGLDVPYRWFTQDNEGTKAAVLNAYLRAISRHTPEDFASYLAQDAEGRPCIEAKSPLDLERSLGLPRGNIFHGNLTWPFAESEEETGTWGVETNYPGVLVCGSSAKRGGAVSGIPGHNAAMVVLGVATG